MAALSNSYGDLSLANYQYSNALAVLFLFYVVSELPSDLVLKRMTPKFWLPFLVFPTGIIMMRIGFVKMYAQFVVVRALLGTAEGGLYPGSLLFLSTLYTCEELALRVRNFYSSVSLSGAFCGLLARGFSAVPATSTGLMTCAIAAAAYPLLPNSVATASFLTPDECDFAVARLKASHWTPGLSEPEFEPERSRWSDLFLPSIIQSLGYTAIESKLLSVPPYAVASVVGVVVAFLSVTKYGLTFLMASGIYGSVPPLLVWILNNSARYYKQAAAGAMQVCLSNCGGIVAAFLYPYVENPSYVKSHMIILGVLCYSWVAVLLNVLHVRKIDKDKERGKYDKYIGYGVDRKPSFKLVL
ncbi:major facilitator superfamily domain-containing protein [Aspergillus oleicola]